MRRQHPCLVPGKTETLLGTRTCLTSSATFSLPLGLAGPRVEEQHMRSGLLVCGTQGGAPGLTVRGGLGPGASLGQERGSLLVTSSFCFRKLEVSV